MATIKEQVEKLRKDIVEAEEKITKLQTLCSHENTKEVNWSWRVGSSNPALVCDDCGKFIKYLGRPLKVPYINDHP